MSSSDTLTHSNWAAADNPEFHTAYEAALETHLAAGGGRRKVEVAGGGAAATGAPIVEVSPGDNDLALGEIIGFTDQEVAKTVTTTAAGFADWRRTPWEERVAILRRLARLIESETPSIAALISLEIGKNRFEATTEVAEAYELIDAYSADMERAKGFVHSYPPLGDEDNVSVMRPYGVWGVVGPFNFPFALSIGMAAAALVTGNVVVIKAPDPAPLSVLKLLELCRSAGLDSSVINVVVGGPSVGRALVDHPDIAGVAFTGSFRVGDAIRETLRGRPMVAEMGGKNPTLVTATADVERAAEAIGRSAFRYSGQKCSACSRVYADASIADELIERVGEAARGVQLGVPWERGAEVGPLINAAAADRYERAVSHAKRRGAQVLRQGVPDELADRGAYVTPAVVVGLPDDDDLLYDELFAPVLCIQRVESLDDAVERANRSNYGLTAGLYSQDEDEIGRFLDGIEAGVVYVNRVTGATTGAWVGHQSFGGWKHSGFGGANAHGPYYLTQFLREQSRTVTRG